MIDALMGHNASAKSTSAPVRHQRYVKQAKERP